MCNTKFQRRIKDIAQKEEDRADVEREADTKRADQQIWKEISLTF